MNKEKVDRLSGLSAVQIAVLAMVGSTIAAVATLMGLRRLGIVRGKPAVSPAEVPPQPAVPIMTKTTVPAHFSEDIVVPGLTYTGADVRAQDERDGRSTEGV
jgi:hypothetical protein